MLYLCIIGDEKYKFHFRIEVNFSNNTIGFFNNSIKNIKTDKFNEALQVLNELNNCNAIGTVYLNKEDESIYYYIGISIEGEEVCFSHDQISDYILTLKLGVKEAFEALQENDILKFNKRIQKV